MLDPKSRYYNIPTEKLKQDGREILYLGRRLLPALESFTDLTEHTVSQGERLDHIARRYLDNPELFWRICDANPALNPSDLTAQPGRRLRIPRS
jgi:hypothetical protein